jgi:hypothetical protein
MILPYASDMAFDSSTETRLKKEEEDDVMIVA